MSTSLDRRVEKLECRKGGRGGPFVIFVFEGETKESARALMGIEHGPDDPVVYIMVDGHYRPTP
jgi:hypothetical protein